MRLAPLSALLLLAACGRSDVYGGAGPTFPVPWVEDDVTEAGGSDGGSADGGVLRPYGPDSGTPDAGPRVPSACAPAPCPVEVLATGQQAPLGIAVNGTHVYWVNVEGDIVRRWPKQGGAVENFSVTRDRPSALAADDTHVYWVSQGQEGELARAPVTGGPMEQLAALPDNSTTRLLAAGGHLYWNSSSVARVAKTGGAPERLVDSTRALSEPSADVSGVYFTEGAGAHVVQVAPDGTRSTLAQMPGELSGKATAVDADFVYVVARVSGGAGQACGGSVVGRVPKAGGAWTELARHPDCAMDVGLDATHVHWMAFASGGGGTSLLRVPKAGGGPEVLASGLPYGWRMAVDATHVYWTEVESGRVARVRK
jgi:hypothetical protein